MPSLADLPIKDKRTTWERLHAALDKWLDANHQKVSRNIGLNDIVAVINNTDNLLFLPGTTMRRVLSVMVSEGRLSLIDDGYGYKVAPITANIRDASRQP